MDSRIPDARHESQKICRELVRDYVNADDVAIVENYIRDIQYRTLMGAENEFEYNTKYGVEAVREILERLALSLKEGK